MYIRTHPTQFIDKGVNVYLAQAIRKEVSIPVSTVGAIVDPEMMEEIIAEGNADIVELGRPLLADPYLPNKLREGREKELTKCLRCMGCFGESLKTETTTCTVNPVIGNEFNEWIAKSQPTTPKKVVIIGGGLVGCETADHLARMGKQVSIVELREDVALDSEVFYRTAVKVDMRKNKVSLFTGCKGKKITGEGLVIEDMNGKINMLQADTIICAVGYKADHKLFEKLCMSAPIVQMIGDCRRPGKVTNAVSDGYYMALDI